MSKAPIYVDKRHYDALLNAYGKVILERDILKEQLKTVDQIVSEFSDEQMRSLYDLTGEAVVNAFLVGQISASLEIKRKIKMLEEKCNVQASVK